MFGGESSGLNTDELNLCDHTVTIDKPILDGSLSLPVAVAVVMYEHKRSMLDAGHNIKSNIAEPGQAGALLDRTKELLKKIRFIGNRDDRRVMAKIKDIVKKLSVNEVRLLHTILARAGEEGKNTHESKKQ